MSYVNCKLCPRQCGIDRTAGETGYCGCPDTALVAKTMLHKWEEPALAGNGGSGAIFFGGCTLGCKYCQNRTISATPVGTPMDSAQLRQAMEALIAQAGGTVTGRIAVLAEGDAQNRDDIRFLAPLPLFNADGSVKE